MVRVLGLWRCRVTAQTLTNEPSVRLATCERRIEDGAKMMRSALREIREQRLYQAAGYETFDTYCEERWSLTRRHVDRLVAWDELAEAVRPIGLPEPERESHVRPIADLSQLEATTVWKEAVETAPDGGVTARHVEETRARVLGEPTPPDPGEEESSAENSRRVLHSSESNEWYTPEELIEDVRDFYGGTIDLDPASCEEANKVVKATTFYTIEDDGLSQTWFGRVWNNAPYGKDEKNESNQAKWSRRASEKYRAGEYREGMLLCNAAVGARWFAPLWQYWVCLLYGRLKFWTPDGSDSDQPTHYSALVYLGARGEEFTRQFSSWGRVVPPMPLAAIESLDDGPQSDLERYLEEYMRGQVDIEELIAEPTKARTKKPTKGELPIIDMPVEPAPPFSTPEAEALHDYIASVPHRVSADHFVSYTVKDLREVLLERAGSYMGASTKAELANRLSLTTGQESRKRRGEV